MQHSTRDALVVNESLRIPLAELRFRASRSGGPGGQHVNTSSTRVELEYDVANSPSLDEEQRARIRQRLANRIAADGVLRLASSRSRSQHRNREDAVDRLGRLLADALRERKQRRPTKPSRASKQARLEAKRHRSRIKKDRGPVTGDE